MKKGSWIAAVLAVLVILGVLILGYKLISGAIGLVSGALNTILGLALIAALVILVLWMFRYAAKKRK